MKFVYGLGWYKVRGIVDGVKYEVTYFDGKTAYCEDVRLSSWENAATFCKERINLLTVGH